MTYKLTWLINQTADDNRTAGFSESWYYDGDVAGAKATINNFANARANLLTANAVIMGARLQEVGGLAQAIKLNVPGVFDRGMEDIPQLAANCRVFSGTNLSKKYFQLRGVPDQTIAGGSIWPEGLWVGRCRTFLATVASLGLKFRARDTTQAQKDVISIDAAGVCTIAAGLVIAQNAEIQILRGRDLNGRSVAGTYRIINRASDTVFTLGGWRGVALATRAKARLVAYAYLGLAVGGGEVVNVAVRKVGRPFGGYRGRSKRR